MLEIPVEALVVGTTARLDAQKAPLDMVRAFAALERRDVQMVWIGEGELRAETERLIKRKGIADRFHLLGNRRDVAKLLPALDVFALSSLYEGLPCAVAEAMTLGIPVVATAVNSVPEIVLAGKTGLLARPGDPTSLARALAYMLDHRGEALRMAEAARAYIGRRFHPDAFGARPYGSLRACTSVRFRPRAPKPRRPELMRPLLQSAGESIVFDCALDWVADLIGEGSARELRDVDTPASIQVSVDSSRHAFDTRGWCRLTRGAWRREGEVVLENACTSGFDLHAACSPAGLELDLSLASAGAG